MSTSSRHNEQALKGIKTRTLGWVIYFTTVLTFPDVIYVIAQIDFPRLWAWSIWPDRWQSLPKEEEAGPQNRPEEPEGGEEAEVDLKQNIIRLRETQLLWILTSLTRKHKGYSRFTFKAVFLHRLFFQRLSPPFIVNRLNRASNTFSAIYSIVFILSCRWHLLTRFQTLMIHVKLSIVLLWESHLFTSSWFHFAEGVNNMDTV